MAYEDLSLRERAAIIKTAVHNGYRHLPDIVDAYNKFDEGGELYNAGNLPEVIVEGRQHIPVETRNDTNWLRERLYNNIEPKSYDNFFNRVGNALLGNNTRTNDVNDEQEAYWAYYMNQNPELVNRMLESSPLRPTQGNAKYETVVRPKSGISDEILSYGKTLPIGSNGLYSDFNNDIQAGLGNFIIGHGEDEKGKYVSIYDDWDLSTGASNTGDMTLGIGTPFTVYDRRYYDEGGYINNKPINFGNKIDTRMKLQNGMYQPVTREINKRRYYENQVRKSNQELIPEGILLEPKPKPQLRTIQHTIIGDVVSNNNQKWQYKHNVPINSNIQNIETYLHKAYTPNLDSLDNVIFNDFLKGKLNSKFRQSEFADSFMK